MSGRRVLKDADIDSAPLAGKSVAVIGYGNQGHAHALNLLDAGVDVKVGLREGSNSQSTAEAAGLTVVSQAQAATSDVVMILVPDETQPDLFSDHVKDNLRAGSLLLFGHGFALHHHLIAVPEGIEAAVVAPVGPGYQLRESYVAGEGIPGLVAVDDAASEQTRSLALAYAKAIGLGRVGVIIATVREEVETDLFGEQAVICGGVSALIRTGVEVLTEAGYPEELAYYECAHQMKLLVDLIHSRGIAGMRDAISNTAKYGDVTRGPRVIDDGTKKRMQQILQEVQSGAFAREWMAEVKAGSPNLERLVDEGRNHPLENVGARLRALAKPDQPT